VLKLDARTGRLDPAFVARLDGPVRGLALAEDRLSVSGAFTRVGELRRRNLGDDASARRSYDADGGPASRTVTGASRVSATAPGAGGGQLVAGVLRRFSTLGTGRGHGVVLPPRG